MKWVLGLDERTTGYMVREERKKEKLRTRMRRRNKRVLIRKI